MAGCSSGGGGPQGSEQLPHQPEDTRPKEPFQVDVEGKVKVGVVDTGFRTTHEVFEEKIAFQTNSVDGTKNVGGESEHGTGVASVISQQNENSVLLLAKANASGEPDSAKTATILHGVKTLANKGARVINASYSGLYNAMPDPSTFDDETPQDVIDASQHRGVHGYDALKSLATSNGGKGSVYVVAAGNSDKEMTNTLSMETMLPEVFSKMLIVGATDADGNPLVSYPKKEAETLEYSNYPGADLGLQSRFLMARGDGGIAVATDDNDTSYWSGEGTSFAAPLVSSYAATIVHNWPHLDAGTVSGLLLETADRSHALYEITSITEEVEVETTDEEGNTTTETQEVTLHECGVEPMSCGDFFMGKGVADLDAALNPKGDIVIPTHDHLDEGGVDPASSYISLSKSFGKVDASALDNIAVFDELGRDYMFDLSSGVVSKHDYDKTQIDKMTKVAEVGRGHVTRDHVAGKNFAFTQSFSGNGSMLASRFDAKLADMTLSGFQFKGDELNPMDIRSESGFMPMMSWQGGSSVTESLGDAKGFAVKQSLFHPDVSFGVSHWSGKSDFDTRDYSASESGISLGWSVTPSLSLEFGSSLTSEENGLLGSSGNGLLSFGDDNEMQSYNTTVSYEFSPSLSGFATYAMGKGDIDGSGMIKGINNMRTSEMSLGLQWAKDAHQLGFAFSQPSRIESATMTLDVPVGRDLQGNVIRETREMSLSPSGRQRDIEIGYARRFGEAAKVTINVMHSMEPGHDEDADSDTSVVLSLQKAF